MKTISFIELCELIKEGNAPWWVCTRGEKAYHKNGNYLYENGQVLFDKYNLDLLTKLSFEIPLEPLLTDKEKAYLRGVIEPFKTEVDCIIKKKYYSCSTLEYIKIITKDDVIEFPLFEQNKYYKGLKLDKKYSLKELDLD